MGVLDWLFGVGSGGTGRLGRRNLKRGGRLLAEGTAGRARIDGIKVRKGTDDDPDVYEYALVLEDGRRLGCRQRLPDDARLGRSVDVRFDDKRAIVDLHDGDAWGYKAVDPPAPGIDDDRHRMEKEQRKGTAVRLTVLGVEPVEVFGMTAENVNIRVQVDDAYETVVKRALVPTYAAHLTAPGTVLPGYARNGRPDKVRIDWPAAAVADAS